MRRAPRASWRWSRGTRQRGWGATEYLSVLTGLMLVWWGAEQVLGFIQEHHDEFVWALMIPY